MAASDSDRRLAIIAGSGFHDFAGARPGHELSTPFGAPSAAPRTLSFGSCPVHFLPRHGDDHSIPPHRINYRANLAALKSLGARQVIALNTVGIIASSLHPGELAVPRQLIDYTYGRDHSIHEGKSATLEHIDFTEPFCAQLRRQLLAAAAAAGIACHDGGVYAVTQGPRLETAAEIDRLERDGAHFVGMTAMPEASIARELHMNYACLSLLVNYAAGRGEKAIHEDIDASLDAARATAIRLLEQLFRDYGPTPA